jgi:hypothetical protein
MYITSVKKNTGPGNNRAQLNLIDSLFGEYQEPDVIVDAGSFIRTITRTAMNYELEVPENYFKNVRYINSYLKNFLENHNIPDMYYEFKIPKKSGGLRTIDAPNDELKTTMTEVTNMLRNKFKLNTHDSAFAYVKNRSVVDAVKEHNKNDSRWFLKIDLHNFFGSCNKEFIINQLSQIYPFAQQANTQETHSMLERLAEFATLNDGLPQGTPLSPVLTNWLMIPYDYKINLLLNNLVKQNKILKQRYIYTRYADDIIISAKEKFNYNIVVEHIKNLFMNSPLELNETKTRFGSNAGRNWNLGIMLNKDNKLTVGHKRKRYIKDNVYYFIKFKETWDKEQCRWLLGNLAWLQNVEPDYYNGLLNYYYNKFNINVVKELQKIIKK